MAVSILPWPRQRRRRSLPDYSEWVSWTWLRLPRGPPRKTPPRLTAAALPCWPNGPAIGACSAGDAHPDVLIEGIDRLVGPDNVLEVDVFKLPHHGSKANVTSDLLRRVRAHTYVFSTNGRGNQRHPDDEAVARVIQTGQPRLAFNYRNERTGKWADPGLVARYGVPQRSTHLPGRRDSCLLTCSPFQRPLSADPMRTGSRSRRKP